MLFLAHFWLSSESYCTCAYGCSLLGERLQSLLYNYGWYEWYGLMSHGLGRLGGSSIDLNLGSLTPPANCRAMEIRCHGNFAQVYKLYKGLLYM